MVSKFIMKFLIVFILINSGSSMNPFIEINEHDVGVCTENVGLIWQFIWNYFKNMHAVALFAHKDTSLDFTNEIIKSSMQNSQLSIQHNFSFWNVTSEQSVRKLEKHQVLYHHQKNGLIFIAESIEIIQTILSTIDPQTKAVIILMNASVDDVCYVLKTGWSEHHLLNLVVFRTNEASSLYASAYDPFTTRDDVRGFIHTFSMKSDDLLMSRMLNILNTRLNDVHGYPLRPYMWESSFSQVIESKALDSMILKEMINIMKFSVSKCESCEKEMPGEVYFDISTISSSMKYYGQNYSEFLFPIGKIAFGFVVPKIRFGSTTSFISIFTPGASVVLAFAYFGVVIVWRWIQNKHRELMKTNVEEIDFVRFCFIIFGNFLLVSQPGSGDKRYERCLFMGWILFSMIICYSYQGTMVKHLALSNQLHYIKTMDDLAGTDPIILVPEKYLREVVDIASAKNTPESFKRLLRSSHLWSMPFDQAIVSIIEDPGRILVYSAPVSWLPFFRYLTDDMVHVLEEKLIDTYDSFMVSLDCPYKERFEQIILMIEQSGLAPKWVNDYDTELMYSFYGNHRDDPIATDDVYKMKDLSFIFWCWVGCLGFCSAVFLGELLWVRVAKERKGKKKNIRGRHH